MKRSSCVITCARAAYNTVVNDGATVDCDLQAVVCVVVLGGFIIRIELQRTQRSGRLVIKQL